MSLLGNPISSMIFPVDSFTGTGTTTTFQLSRVPANVSSIGVYVDGLKILTTAYTLNGLQLIFNVAPINGASIEVTHLGILGQVNVPADGTIITSTLGSITNINTKNTESLTLGSNNATAIAINSNNDVIVGSSTVIPVAGAIRPFSVVAADSTAFLGIGRWTNDSAGGGMAFQKSRGTTLDSYTSVLNGDALGSIFFGGTDGTNNVFGARISAFVDGIPGTNDMPGRLVFATTPSGSNNPVERMRINNAGNVGIGSGGGGLTGYALRVYNPITGLATAHGIRYDGTINSDVTSDASIFYSRPTTQATTFTLSNLNHFLVAPQAYGAGTTITNQYGFIAASTLTGATNNYGFHSSIASGTGRWNFYANGTADNYFAGVTTVGTLTNTNASTLAVGGTISETVGSTQYLVASQFDVGSDPNDIPINQYLGNMAYMNSNQVVINPVASATPAGIGDMVFQLTSDTSLVIKVKGSDGVVRSATLTLA
jgi:hypothetical protein